METFTVDLSEMGNFPSFITLPCSRQLHVLPSSVIHASADTYYVLLHSQLALNI